MSIRSSLLGLLVTASVAAGGGAPAFAGDSHMAWVRNEMHQVRTGDYTYRVDMNEGNRLIPRFDRYANYLRRTRNPRDLMFPDPRPEAYKNHR